MDFRYDGYTTPTTSTPLEASSKVRNINKASRKVGAITSSGDASTQEWKKCVEAQIAHDSCQGGYKIVNVDGCRTSNGYDSETGSTNFLVPDSIKAPMSQSSKESYTAAYNDLKNLLYKHQSIDAAKDMCNTLVPDMNGGKRHGKKRVKKTRGKKTHGKKRVKKTRTKRKHIKKRGKKTRGKKKSKSKGTRKRSYRRRR